MRESGVFITSRDIVRASTTIIAFVFASLGFLLNARNSETITGEEFDAIVESVLLILLVFSIPVIAFLALDLFEGVIPIDKRKCHQSDR